MSRRDRRADGGKDGSALSSPFRELRKLVGKLSAPQPARKPPQRARKTPPAPRPDEPEDDEALFLSATAGVVPLSPEARNQARGRPPTRPSVPSAKRETLEVLSELASLVNGGGHFAIADTDEHAEGWIVGLDPRVLQRLRAGEFSVQAHVDLHGMTVEEARNAVRQFVLRALRAGYRCILIVHGRGKNSPDRRPVLKDALKGWLSHGELAHVVLAFSTARPCDGGAGATYVLLRRQRRRKKPFQTT